MFTFLHTFHPSSILLNLGPVQIHWYGLLICLAILAGLFVANFLGKRVLTRPELACPELVEGVEGFDLAFWLIVFAIIGARLYDCLLDWSYYAANPWDVFKIWQGGLAIHGALIGGASVLLYFYWKKHYDFWLYASIIAPGIALGQAIGRWGNYFNQELFGLPTNWPWGIPIDVARRPIQFLSDQYFQPTFLYESLGDLLIFILLFCFFIKEKNTKIKQKIIFLSYLIAYSALRFGLEFIKVDSTPTAFGLRAPQWISLVVGLGALGYLIYILLKPKNLESKI